MRTSYDTGRAGASGVESARMMRVPSRWRWGVVDDTNDGPSLRSHTGRIRHLDAGRARELVGLFARPVAVEDDGVVYDRSDPVTAATYGWLSLDHAAAEQASADVVGHYSSHLYLHELLRLPPSVARELAAHRGHLYLDKLTTLSPGAAAALAEHRGGGLSLNNLQMLPPHVAAVLGRHEGPLTFKRLRVLGPKAAAGLAAHRDELYLGGLERLPVNVAARLALHGGDLQFDRLQRLSSLAAAHLARHRGRLHLHGLPSLTTRLAAAFARREGFLCLRDVSRLSAKQAAFLARHKGPLLFNSLRIDDTVAMLLGRHEGSLAIRIDDAIPPSQLHALLQHVGQLALTGLVTVDERRAEILAGQRLWRDAPGLSGLFLNDVKRLSTAAAGILATHRAGGLSLNGLALLSEDLAERLLQHPLLCLDGVKSVTDRVANLLASYQGGVLSLKGLERVSGSAVARLRDNPRIELPTRLREPDQQMPAHQEAHGRDSLIPAIGRLASAGEHALRA